MKFNKKLLLSSAAVAGLLLSAATPVLQVNAASNNAPKTTNVNPKAVIENKPSLTKQGYVLRIKNDKDADPIYVGKANYNYALKHFAAFKGKTISPAKVQNVKFRVEKVVKFHGKVAGAPLYLVASKDKKYSCWTTQSMLQYYYFNSKSMKGVTAPLKRIMDRSVNKDITSLKNKQNMRDYNAAMKAANKLKGSQKKFAVNSLKQLKKDGSIDIEGDNLLLFGL
ncbi:MAG: hypothetical protein ACI4T3_01100 [Lactobacillus sp.]